MSGDISQHKVATCPCSYCAAARAQIMEAERPYEKWEPRTEEDGVIIRGQPS